MRESFFFRIFVIGRGIIVILVFLSMLMIFGVRDFLSNLYELFMVLIWFFLWLIIFLMFVLVVRFMWIINIV